MEASFPADAEQDRICGDAKAAIKRNAYNMRKATDENNMREALRFSAAMLSELRTSQLSPQKYYELYMLVFDQLVNLETYFADEPGKGRTFSELYEMVQHAGNVLPRLYLMVAVGCLYIKSKEASAHDILKDLVEMCKGVQHPTRGLFLRSYLCQRSRSVLPDTSSGNTQNLHDALDFLLSNFVEMNKLWVRMQNQGNARDREKREKERQQLADLVGKNLTYISQLDGLGYEVYSTQVLPRVMEQVISCKDDIAQQYLFQAIVQVFPDNFHLGTLNVLLEALPELQPGVKITSCMASLMDRLAKYAASDKAVMSQLLSIQAFDRFRDAIAHVIAAQPGMPAVDAIEMYVSLMNFTSNVHPKIIANVNQVLAAAYQALKTRRPAGDSKAERTLVTLLTLPITKYDVVTGLGLTEYPLLMGLLRQRTHKELATRIVHTVLDTNTKITSVEKATMLFRFIQPLVHDAPITAASDASSPTQQNSQQQNRSIDDLDDEDVQMEQVLVARLIHSFYSDNPAEQFQLLLTAQEELNKGGPRRMRHTLPALGFAGLALVRRVTRGGQSGPGATPEALLQWTLGVAMSLAEVPEPLLALRLMLAAAYSASEEAGLEMLAYEFMEQAMTLYEESVSDQRARITALQTLIGTLYGCHVFTQDNRDTLVQDATPATGPNAQPPVRDATKVLALLKRAIKVSNAAKQQQAAASRGLPISIQRESPSPSPPAPSYVSLYVEILNHYLTYFELGVDAFTVSVVQQLLDLVAGEVAPAKGTESPAGGADAEAIRYWKSTLQHIQRMSSAAPSDVQARFAQLKVNAAAQ